MTTKQGQKTDGAANRAAISELQLSVFLWPTKSCFSFSIPGGM